MIDTVARSLTAVLVDCDAREIADAIWLAARLPVPHEASPAGPDRARISPDADDSGQAAGLPQVTDSDAVTEGEPVPAPPSPQAYDQPDLGLTAGGATVSGSKTIPATAVGLRAPATMNHPLANARAFSLFKRVQRPGPPVVDIDATVEAIADTRHLIVVTCPGQERGLDIALVVDKSSSMVIWDDALAEFENLLLRVGAFRSVTRWSLATKSDSAGPTDQIMLRDSSNVEHHPNRLIDPAGQRLVLIVTDGVADHWHASPIWSALDRWARSMPTAVVNLLPEEYWGYTPIGSPSIFMSTRRPAGPNSTANVKLAWWAVDDSRTSSPEIPLPVVAFHPDSFTKWAKAITAGTVWADAIPIRPPRTRPAREINADFSAEDRVRAFQARSSREAQALARVLAGAPNLSLPLVRMLQANLLPGTGNSHLAEVVVSGLFERPPAETTSPSMRLRFRPGVSELLRRGTTATDEWNTFEVISIYLEGHAGPGAAVRALLADPQGVVHVDAALKPFAEMGRQVALRLGVEIPDAFVDAEPAQETEQGTQSPAEPRPQEAGADRPSVGRESGVAGARTSVTAGDLDWDLGGGAGQAAGDVVDIPVVAAGVRWERPTARSFWNSLADPEREALAAAGVEEVFRPGTVLCRAGDDASQVMIIDSGWVKVSIPEDPGGREKILAVRGQGDLVGERTALTTGVRSATVTALDEVSTMVVPAERFAEFLRGHPRAAEVLERQVTERREEDPIRLFPGERADAERRLAWLLLDLAQRRGGYQHAAFTLPMSQTELADWAGTSADAVSRFLRSWRDRGIIARSERSRRLTVVDLDGLAALCDPVPQDTYQAQRETPDVSSAHEAAAQWQRDWREPLNCSVLLTDVAGFSDPVRTDSDRDVVRAAMYEILRSAFEASGVPWAACYREDRGDGVVIVVPPTISTQRVVDPLVAEMAARLRQYNRLASEVVRIQLRVALNVGPVGRDHEGLTGQAPIAAARILDAPVIKARLAAEQADLVFAASDYVYDHVVRNCDGRVDPAAFEHMESQVKETRVSAWVYVAPPGPDQAAANAPGGSADPLPVTPPLGNLPPEVRGRDGLIGELRRALRPYPWRASRAFVIAGMGGLGKSTVALTAARMARERGYRVWWVAATDTALLTNGMVEVLRELGAPESVTVPVRESVRSAPARAWEFLNGDQGPGRRWLLVFDGADNPAVLAGADATTPADGTGWLRADPAGMVIVTTRIRDPQVWGTRVTLRELHPLDDEAGAEVLRDLASEVADPGGREARELSRRLGGLPLALHLAGTYLGSPFAHWSTFAGYREALDGVELPAALTDIEEQGADIHATVQRTWDLSLDALAAEGWPQARPLLLVLSCFAPATPIPAWLLQLPPLAELLADRTASAGERDNAAERRGLRAGLQGLSRTGLIEIAAGGSPAGLTAVTVHPVVADANRIRLAASADAEHAAVPRTVVALLEAATAGLDSARPGDWPTWRLLMPHVNAAIDLLADALDLVMLARLLTVSAVGTEALLSGGRLAAAEKLAQASVAAATFLSRDDPAAMTARGYLARTLVRRGRSGEAETLYRELLADRLRVQGQDHLDTLATRRDLAAALGVQGRYGEAEQLYRRLLADDDRLLGPEHRETLAARSSLARMIGLQGRYAEAEELGRRVLEVQRRVLGPDHPDCLASRQNLARVAGKAGRYAEAEQLYRQVLADRRRILGDDHPDTLATRHRLAQIVGQRGRYGEAEELCHRVLADRRRLLGEDHPDNLSTRHRLARMLGLQGRYADAEPMFRQVLAARRRTLGAEHPDTLSTEHRLGWLVGRQGRYTEAIDIVNEVLGGRRNVLGDDHPDTLAARETLAWLTGLRGKLPEAEELCRDVLADRRRVLGEDHPDTLTTRGTLAWTAELRGRYADAEQQYRALLADRQRILGPGHPDTLVARQDVARMLGQQRRYAEAEQLTREVLADRRRLLGDDHPDTLTSRATLARLAARQGRRAEAEELYRQVIADRTRVLGADHPDTATVRTELAQAVAPP